MPELPEVETIKKQVQSFLPFKIESFNKSALSQRLLKSQNIELPSRLITQVRRYAKWLIFDLSPDGYILSHLGMSGSWRLSSSPLTQEKHAHFTLSNSSNNKYLTYVDPRRFGHLYILDSEAFKLKMQDLPPDILSEEFNLDWIAEAFLKNSFKLLKVTLLDQKIFPGVGNYMASEICARAGILPFRTVGSITAEEIIQIKNAITEVCHKALLQNGTTFGGGYSDAFGNKGSGILQLAVFYQTNCQLCASVNRQTKVEKITLAGRGTYYCPHCQK